MAIYYKMGNLALNGHCGQTAKDKAEEKQREAQFVKEGGAKIWQEQKENAENQRKLFASLASIVPAKDLGKKTEKTADEIAAALNVSDQAKKDKKLRKQDFVLFLFFLDLSFPYLHLILFIFPILQ